MVAATDASNGELPISVNKSKHRIYSESQAAQFQTAAKLDAGAVFVLESKGTWLHAGYHLTTSIAAPALLSLPFAFTGLGWGPGTVALILGAAITFYSYVLISKVLEDTEAHGHRIIRFRDLAGHVLGPTWSTFVVLPVQFVLCLGTIIGSTLLAGQSMKIIYLIYHPHGSMKLYEFIIIVGIIMIILSQLPSFHSLRYLNLLSLLMCLGYSTSVVGASIYAGHSSHAPSRDYSLPGSSTGKIFNAFNALAIIATTYGNGIIPEIQATLAPPVAGKMVRGLLLTYAVVVSTFFSVAFSGYWAFGNLAAGNIFYNFAPTDGPSLIPNWLLFLANMFVIVQLFAVALVYSQPTFEIIEGRASDVEQKRFALRNFLPRLVLRSVFIAVATLIAAMIPFFGDINAFIGAFGFTPLDFVFPMILYNANFKPSPRTLIFWVNMIIMVVYTAIGILGCISAIRQIVIDSQNYKLFANV
ncbi:hypothetical protein O6H91_08G020600 [Diphasiastrum complanatum]|uniref:Uncharacterized protein n=3 Tax=Diphasiastrum complanatum TaxID=34168 RepID=A0ACC2CVN1_DIPCM|nr:hypothetical protein O6H91_08G020600 [Diphasiastrum complanatum]KAJ7546024.1 hypothetical protein O6H91_08G020600 [Diphasiastrum complanatum]KAJ7546025.1 hypothetical protein O6H91_08G020600 [Diphasiastrum complanatum]